MAKKAARKKEVSAAQKVGLGVGLTAAAVTAAGAYFLYGSNSASKNRKKVKSWALKAKAEVLEALETAEEMTQDDYEALVKGVVGVYGTVQGATKGELKDFQEEMKGHWKKIEKSSVAKKVVKKANVAQKKVAKAAKKAIKKATKKTAPKKTAAKTTKKTPKKSLKKAPKKTTKKA